MEKGRGNLIFTPRTLELADLPFLQDMGDIENGRFHMKKSARGRKLKTPTSVSLDKILALKHKGLAEYIIKNLSSKRPIMVPFVLGNRCLVDLARYLFRYRSASSDSLTGYIERIWHFSRHVGNEPDALIADVKDEKGMPRQDRIQLHIKALEDYVAVLQDNGHSPGEVDNHAMTVKTFYRVNGIPIALPHSLSRKRVGMSHAPTPEELSKILGYADLREAVVVSMLALGGFREGTLIKLRYRHAKHDIEHDITPIHIHVEAAITKGRYHDYDTFLGAEAAEFLKLYLDSRRRGSPDGKIPPEEIVDESPLIRNSHDKVPKPICTTKQVYTLVHNLYFKAGLLIPSRGGYTLKAHSLRKFFKTQLMALGVQSDYIDYMMGHTIDTYNDIQMKGVEFLRGIYAAKDFSIRPKPKLSPLEQARIFCRGMGLDPEKVLVKDAFVDTHRVYIPPEEFENHQIQVLTSAGKDKLMKDIIAKMQSPKSPEIHRWKGGCTTTPPSGGEIANSRDVKRKGLKRRRRDRG